MPYETVPAAPGGGGGGGGVTDHGDLDGLADNDHPQYARLAAAGLLTHGATSGNGRQLVLTGSAITSTDDTVANVRTVTIDAAGGVTDHGALTGLGDNDHPQYFLQGTDVITDTEHGSRGGGSLHAVVIAGGAAGFMSGADKTKLDGLGAAPYKASQVLGSAQTSITFSGLNGDTDLGYIIRGFGPCANTAQISLYCNGALCIMHNQQQNDGGSWGAASGFMFYSYPDLWFEIHVAAKTTGVRRGFTFMSHASSGGSRHNILGSGHYNDTSTNITSIVVTAASASSFLTGFRATIEAVTI